MQFINKYNMCIILSTLLILNGCKPSTSNILRLSYDKCQSIENGYYEMDLQLKMLSNIDTFHICHTSYFKKTPEDAIYSYMFHSRLATTFHDTGQSNINLLYTGNEVVHYTDDLESLAYRESDIFKIKNVYVKNPAFSSFIPITDIKSKPLLDDEKMDLIGDKIHIEFIGSEIIDDKSCYHIKAILDPELDSSTIRQYSAGLEYHYWINKEDYLPIQFTIKKNYFINNDSVNEFSKYKLTNYCFNKEISDSIFTLSSLPNPDRISNENVEVTDSLKVGRVVPNWEVKTLGGEVFSYANAKKLTILNFFYATCPPCIELHPFLDELNDEFQSQGLQVIGLSHIDTFKNLEYFKDKYQINHIIGKGSEQLFIDFEVLAYPTTYLINQGGFIILKSVGKLSKEEQEKLRSVIIANM